MDAVRKYAGVLVAGLVLVSTAYSVHATLLALHVVVLRLFVEFKSVCRRILRYHYASDKDEYLDDLMESKLQLVSVLALPLAATVRSSQPERALCVALGLSLVYICTRVLTKHSKHYSMNQPTKKQLKSDPHAKEQ